jgi:protein TonB
MRLAMALPVSGETETPVLPLTVSIAIGLHVALALFAPTDGATMSRALPPMEVELAPPAPPKPKEIEVPKPEALEPEKAPPPPRAAAPRAPAPAAAGKLLTAEPAAQATDAPLDFVTDPNGGQYGFGVVARGGSKEPREGVAAPVPSPSIAAGAVPKAGDGLVAAADLSEKPRLVNDDPCAGFYPSDAVVDTAFAVVRVIVERDGRTRNVQLVNETPAGQGFGPAARRCLSAQRWSPAKDHDGHAVPTATTFRVHFRR